MAVLGTQRTVDIVMDAIYPPGQDSGLNSDSRAAKVRLGKLTRK